MASLLEGNCKGHWEGVQAVLGDNVVVEDKSVLARSELGPKHYSIVDELDPSLRWRID
jgi:hypothetical protein